ncbi:hypothetical protein J8J14_09585 [Roseomonas sp. SSH11]|uniref:Uncharacterized protein n=1 Tax=Pararoseomonas baculiformis TaxID=2820812 RepID=A0ABS4ADU2_9PROT|nr:hypothetical protein [Pararoseomonas baculiformis]MBP0445031.1 hypothetical protein [Pararoseomonas baculiformis]
MYLTRAPMPPGMARLKSLAPVDEGLSTSRICFLIEYETVDGPDQVVLSPERVRDLGIVSAYVNDALVPIPKP